MSLQVPAMNLLNSQPKSSTPDEKEEVNHKIVILYTKEITSQDLEMIRRHGKVIFFNSSLINVDLKTIDADYIMCDANDVACLRSLEKHFNDDKDNIDFCAFCHFFEKNHFDNMNAFATFKDAKDKTDFDFLLLNKKNFKKPNTLLSCAYYLVNFLVSLKK